MSSNTNLSDEPADHAIGRSRVTPERTLGDKAYSSKANRQMLREQSIQAVFPEKTDQVVNRKRRNAIERCFAVVKQWRGIVTRYDKLALPYRSGVVLRALTIWLNESGDMPWLRGNGKWLSACSIRSSTPESIQCVCE